jgi:tetratricopeptide (TPR) repeat protein
MDISFEEQLSTASVLLEANELEKSIEHYEDALELARRDEEKISLNNLLGTLYLRNKKPSKALQKFETSIILYNTKNDTETLPEKAAVFNNIGAIYLESNLKLAIENYASALQIYESLVTNVSETFHPHLANTYFALADAFYKKNDFYSAKKNFKKAIKLYDLLESESFQALKAKSLYQLGAIYSEEFNLHDAKVNYLKSLALFENAAIQNKDSFQPFLAAVLNNLGVTYKSMDDHQKALEYYERGLKQYENLVERNSTAFSPYLAATCNSIAILLAEMDDFTRAIEYGHKAMRFYNDLVDSSPQNYSHYLANSIHNLGLFYFGQKEMKLAERYFIEALTLRKKLAFKEPESFDADVCATALNLVELYQAAFENNLDIGLKSKCLDLLANTDIRLKKYDDDRLVLESMKRDCNYYINYFETITLEQLSLDSTFRKIDDLIEEINGTLNPVEKITFQKKIVELLKKQGANYPQNEKIKNELTLACNNLESLNQSIK